MINSVRQYGSTLMAFVLFCYGCMLLQAPVLKAYHWVAYTSVVMNAQFAVHNENPNHRGEHVHSQEHAANLLEEIQQSQQETEKRHHQDVVQKQKKDFKITSGLTALQLQLPYPFQRNFK